MSIFLIQIHSWSRSGLRLCINGSPRAQLNSQYQMDIQQNERWKHLNGLSCFLYFQSQRQAYVHDPLQGSGEPWVFQALFCIHTFQVDYCFMLTLFHCGIWSVLQDPILKYNLMWKTHLTSLSSRRFQALYNYMPRNEDELELKEGDVVDIMEKCDDGWFVGKTLNYIFIRLLVTTQGAF